AAGAGQVTAVQVRSAHRVHGRGPPVLRRGPALLPASASPWGAQIEGTDPSVHGCLAHGSPPGRSLASTAPSRPPPSDLRRSVAAMTQIRDIFSRRFEKIEPRPPHPVPKPPPPVCEGSPEERTLG